ncbi:MAG: ABC transporter permease subunit [Chloroflexi bacterium]|nr:MAG: ABC transporter permease subunit [Chloroflexota bacterium]
MGRHVDRRQVHDPDGDRRRRHPQHQLQAQPRHRPQRDLLQRGQEQQVRAELAKLGQRRERQRASRHARQDIHQADGRLGRNQLGKRQDHGDTERRLVDRLKTEIKGAGSMGLAVATPELEPAHRRSRGRRVNLLPYALVTPSVTVIAGILAFPLGMLVWLSLQRYGLRELIAHQGVWAGLDNYRSIAADPLFRQVVVRSLLFTTACVALTICLSTLIAMLLMKVRRWIRILLMSALVFVWATPVIVTVDIWQWMFDYEFGVINYLLTRLHVGNFIHHNWFDNPLQGLAVLVLVVVWGAIPFVTITVFAGLLQVPGDVIDAARVDGAGPWQTFWRVTAPMLKPIFLIVICLSTIWDFGVFNQIYVMLNQRPSADYFVIAIYSYRESFGVAQYGLGAAIAVVMVLVLVFVTFFYVRETVKVAEIA